MDSHSLRGDRETTNSSDWRNKLLGIIMGGKIEGVKDDKKDIAV
jgi:hypothetical protein